MSPCRPRAMWAGLGCALALALAMSAAAEPTPPRSPAPAAAFSCNQVSEIPRSECEALVALYESTNGIWWAHSDNWLQTNTPSNWEGVRITDGHVSQLYLGQNYLTGSLPPEIGDFPALKELSLPNNEIPAPIPPEIGRLASLEKLVLSNSRLQGPIPPEIGLLSNLRSIDLWHNPLGCPIPSEIGQLANLVWLKLDHAQLTGPLPASITQLTQLGHLDVSFNVLTGTIPTDLGAMQALGTLHLGYNRFEGTIPESIGQLKRLSRLYLEFNQLTGPIPTSLGDLVTSDGPRMLELRLDHNRLSGPIPVELCGLTSLTMLNLSHNAFLGEIPVEFVNLLLPTSKRVNLDLGYNALMTSHAGLLARLAANDPDWADTQTVPPLEVRTIWTGGNSIGLQWRPIRFHEGGGHYEVHIATTPGGPYSLHGVTADKQANSCVVSGLQPETDYYLAVRTYTPKHDHQQTALWSVLSHEVTARTSGAVGQVAYLPLARSVPGAFVGVRVEDQEWRPVRQEGAMVGIYWVYGRVVNHTADTIEVDRLMTDFLDAQGQVLHSNPLTSSWAIWLLEPGMDLPIVSERRGPVQVSDLRLRAEWHATDEQLIILLYCS